MNEEKIYCSHCGEIIEGDDYDTIYGEPVCEDCIDRYTTVCDRCEEIVWDEDIHSDESTCLCHRCFENYYTRCEECDSIVHNDDAYEYDARTSAETHQSTNMATNLCLFSTAIQTDISVLNLKLTEQAKTTITLMKYLILPTQVMIVFT